MLVLLPPSEGKRAPTRGRRLDLDTLSAPELTAARRGVLEALVNASARDDAGALLGVPTSLSHQIRWDATLFTSPSAPAGQVYDGVLYDALDLATLAGADRRRASARLRILSAAYGPVTVNDRITPYRVSPTTSLPGVGDLRAHWRTALAGVLDTQARGLVVDCRSAPYAAMWRPERTDAWVHIAVPGASHMAKHTRGLVARALCQVPDRPRSAEELAALLSPIFTVTLRDVPSTGPRVLEVLEPR